MLLMVVKRCAALLAFSQFLVAVPHVGGDEKVTSPLDAFDRSRQQPTEYASASVATGSSRAAKLSTILIMTHKRPDGVKALLEQIKQTSPSPLSQRIIVAQSASNSSSNLAGSEVEAHVLDTRAVLDSFATSFASIEQVLTPYIQGDASYSRDAAVYGTKRNAANNLLTGLKHVFGADPQLPLRRSTNRSRGTPSDAADAVSREQAPSFMPYDHLEVGNPMTLAKNTLAAVKSAAREGLKRYHGSQPVTSSGNENLAGADAVALGAEASAAYARPATDSKPVADVTSDGDYPVVTEVLVLEDDAVLSDDALAYFQFASELMTRDRNLDFATAFVEFRPNLIVGTRDVDYIRTQRDLDSEYNRRVIDRVHGTPRSVFKTFAWMLSRRGWSALRSGLESVVAAEIPLLRAPPQSTDEDGEGGSSVAVAYRSVHPELAGCTWCNDYCYDHLIEWTLQGSPFLAPALPRVTQAQGRGMTYSSNPTNSIWRGDPVASSQFVVHSSAMAIIRFFQSPGFSAMAPMRPDASSAAAGHHHHHIDTCSSPACRLSTRELIITVITEPLVTFAVLCVVALLAAIGIYVAMCCRARREQVKINSKQPATASIRSNGSSSSGTAASAASSASMMDTAGNAHAKAE